MKIKLFLLTLAMMCIVSTLSLIAQAPPEPLAHPGPLIESITGAGSFAELLTLNTAILTFLINLGGYLSPFLPFFNKIESGTYRVLAWAIIVIAGAILFGFSNIWVGAIAYFFSTSLYEVVLKAIVPSPKPSA